MIDKYCKIRNDIYNLNKNQIKIKNNDNKLILKQMLYKNIDIYAYIFYKYRKIILLCSYLPLNSHFSCSNNELIMGSLNVSNRFFTFRNSRLG